MTRNGKIARLPHAVREELNRRLHEGEPGIQLVAWLNSRDDVRAVLVEHFAGRSINEPNLSAWKKGGFRDWLAQSDLFEQARLTAENSARLTQAGGPLADHLGTILAARFAAALAAWDGQPGTPAAERLRALGPLRHDITALRRVEHGAFRLRLEQERLTFEREKVQAELQKELAYQKRHQERMDRLMRGLSPNSYTANEDESPETPSSELS